MKKGLGKVLAVLFLLTLIANSGSYAAGSKNSQGDPRIIITSINLEELDAGENYELVLNLKNDGYYTARDIEYILEVPDDTPITLTDLQNIRYEEHLYPSSETTLTFGIQVDYDVEEGIYPLKLTGTFYNLDEVAYELDETFNVVIHESEDEDILNISLVSDNEVVAGEDFTAMIQVENTSFNISNAVVSLVDLSSTTIETTAEDSVEYDSILYNESIETVFDLFAYENLESGVYEFQVEVIYDDVNGREQVETESIYFKVDNSEETEPDTLVIESVVNSKDYIYEEESFDVTVVLKNDGEEAIEDIEISISQDEKVIPVTQSIYLIDSIGAYESKTITFTMESTDSATTGNYPLEITVEYNDGDEVLTQYTGIYIENDDEDDDEEEDEEDEDEEDEDITTPRIIIENFTTGLDKIFVGDEFDLDFTLKNTSSLKDIYNLKVIISTEEGNNSTTSVLPINQSNSEYVGDLDMGETYDITIPFKVIANAEGAIYSLTVEFEYEDEDGELYSDSETINLPVYQQPQITVSDVSVGTQLDSAYTLEVDFYNTGKVDITNMMVDIEGDFVTTNSNYYVGDFATGRMDVYDVEVTGSVPATVEGTIIFTYDDTFGEEVEYIKEFSIETGSSNATGTSRQGGMAGGKNMSEEEIQEAMANGGGMRPQGMGTTEEVATGSVNLYLYIGVAVGAILIGVIIIVAIKKRKKNRS